MAYQSLYRRYRPRRFSDVRGQEPVVRALRNAVRDDRVGHAYLFSGPRGTGKTSTARILAKALNCEHLADGEPDGTCDSCLAIDAGTSYDVQELDAASNNGVGDVRELISRVALGSPGRTKVYILDEVHMLSSAASAALLKTLEEPPDHVVFVLATTDPQKVLPTIRSRTQHFEFHLLSVDELTEHVAWVIHDAGLGLDDSVIEHVVRAGAGSARDTLSALDQVAAAGGVLDTNQPVADLLDAVAAGDAGAALVAVSDAVSSGRDPRILGEAVLARLRDVFLLRMGASTDHLAPGDIDRVTAWADQLGDRATTRALEAVGDALLEMRQAPDPRIPLEVALVKITRVDADVSLDGLVARIARLEQALADGTAIAAPAGGAAAPPSASSAPAAAGAPGSSTGPGPARPAPSTPGPAAEAAPGGSGRPAPPPRPGARPADVARAQLAAQRGTKGGPPRPSRPAETPPGPPVEAAAPSTPSGPPSSASSASSGPSQRIDDDSAVLGRDLAADAAERGPEPGSSPTNRSDASDRSGTAPSAPAAAVAAPAATGGGGSLPDEASLAEVWDDPNLDLRGLTKAMYRSGRFTEVSGTTATLALPNEISRDKCEQKRPEVEAALSARFGTPVTLRLVTDAGGGAPGGSASGAGGSGGSSRAEPEADDDFDLGGTDVHDLPDAPAAATGGLDALTEAFPGSELVE